VFMAIFPPAQTQPPAGVLRGGLGIRDSGFVTRARVSRPSPASFLWGLPSRSGSQRNAEHHGFRIAYTRIKWRRA